MLRGESFISSKEKGTELQESYQIEIEWFMWTIYNDSEYVK